MLGHLKNDQGRLFYSFCLEEVVPDDHLVRGISAVLDLSWVHAELAPYYSKIGRPSIDPVLMIGMLIIGYVFGIRSERLLCRESRSTWRIAGSAVDCECADLAELSSSSRSQPLPRTYAASPNSWHDRRLVARNRHCRPTFTTKSAHRYRAGRTEVHVPGGYICLR